LKTENPSLEINGEVHGLSENSAVMLVDGNKITDTLAKGIYGQGRFRINVRLPESNLFYLVLDGGKTKIPVFVGNDHIRISGDIKDPKGLKIEGSTTQQDFEDFQKTFNPLMLQLNGIAQQINSMKFAGKNDSLMKEYGDMNARIQAAEDQFVISKKNSPVSPFVVLVLGQLADPSAMEKRYGYLASSTQESYFGKILKTQVAQSRIGEVGSDELDFSQADTTGKPVQLSSFKGKYVLVDFWASWCHPCRLENPNVVVAYNRFKSKNFTVLGVSLDKARGPWIQAIKEDNLIWTQVSDLKFWNNEVALLYHIQQIPQNMLIGPDGKIVAKNLRGEELQSKLCELLGCN
jgi:peroxiredoxin